MHIRKNIANKRKLTSQNKNTKKCYMIKKEKTICKRNNGNRRNVDM